MTTHPVQDVIWVKVRQDGIANTNLVEAEVWGNLAVHEGMDGDKDVGGGYTVTHVPTGLSLHKGLTLIQARELVEGLGKLDWRGDDPSLLSQRNSQPSRAIFRRVLGEK